MDRHVGPDALVRFVFWSGVFGGVAGQFCGHSLGDLDRHPFGHVRHVVFTLLAMGIAGAGTPHVFA